MADKGIEDTNSSIKKSVLDPDNMQKVKNCQNDYKNYNLYAKSILINAKTGKLLKKNVVSKSNLKANSN